MCTLIPKKYAIMNTLPTNVLYDVYCPKSDGPVREAQKKGGENSPISPPLDPRLRLCNNNNSVLHNYLYDKWENTLIEKDHLGDWSPSQHSSHTDDHF